MTSLSAELNAALGPDLDVSRETLAAITLYRDELRIWQNRINLVAPSTLDALERRHFADSAQLLRCVPNAKRWIDLGSGAGFPGLVLALLLAGNPAAHIFLVESNHKKAAFLRHIVRLTRAPATVLCKRIGDVTTTETNPIACVTARALAPLSTLLDHAEPWLAGGAQAAFLKGRDWRGELTDAAKTWTLDVTDQPSRTDPNGRILVIGRADRRAIHPSENRGEEPSD